VPDRYDDGENTVSRLTWHGCVWHCVNRPFIVDREDDGRAGAGHKPASVGVECTAGERQSAAAASRSRPHRHP